MAFYEKAACVKRKGRNGKNNRVFIPDLVFRSKAIADCDVDALPNLHLVTRMETEPEHSDFIGSEKARIDPQKCTGCGECARRCRFQAVTRKGTYIRQKNMPVRAAASVHMSVGQCRYYGGGCGRKPYSL